jgi:hypothetical protein
MMWLGDGAGPGSVFDSRPEAFYGQLERVYDLFIIIFG